MSIIINTRRIRKSFTIILLFSLCMGLTAKGIAAAVNANTRLLPIYCVQTDKRQIAVTFDAAWGDSDTQELIEILGEYDAVATFFIVGEWADRCSESVKALHNAGHTIANHSDTHAAFSSLDKKGIMKEINVCNEKLRALTGSTPLLLRAPSGDYNNNTIECAQFLNMYTIQWSVDSLDYKGASPEKICERVVEKTKNGSILLFHNDVANTPAALRMILSRLSENGYSFVSVEELIYRDNYTINHAGVQIPEQNEQAAG